MRYQRGTVPSEKVHAGSDVREVHGEVLSIGRVTECLHLLGHARHEIAGPDPLDG
jgi:hypothetical protein